MIYIFFTSRIVAGVNVILMNLLTLSFLYLYFGKNGRDERGRGIFATSCFFSLLLFCVIINMSTYYMEYIMSESIIYKNFVMSMYNSVLIVNVVANLILRKIK